MFRTSARQLGVQQEQWLSHFTLKDAFIGLYFKRQLKESAKAKPHTIYCK